MKKNAIAEDLLRAYKAAKYLKENGREMGSERRRIAIELINDCLQDYLLSKTSAKKLESMTSSLP